MRKVCRGMRPGKRRRTVRKSRRLLFLPAAALGLLGLAGLAGQPVANAQAPTLNVDAGAGQDGNWTNLYLPSSVTVETGTTVQWTIKSGEVHSITFILGQPPAEPVATPSGGSIPDETFVNSDLIPPGATYDVTFTAPGEYQYFCIIHPNMTGTVTVVDPGSAGAAGVDNNESAAARGAAEAYSASFEANANNAALLARPLQVTPKAGGQREYTVILGGETKLSQQNIMYPSQLNLRAGDSVKFKNEVAVPHSATFGAPPPADPFTVPASKAGAAVDGTGFVHTGILLAIPDPTSPTEFVLNFPKAGTYQYACILHPEMTGTITVSAAGAPLPPNTGSGIEAANRASMLGLSLVFGSVLLAMAASATVVVAARRS